MRDVSRSSQVLSIACITVFSLVLLELALTVFYRHSEQSSRRARIDAILASDIYRDVDWAAAFYAELEQVRFAWAPYVQTRKRFHEGKYINIDAAGARKTWNPPPGAGDGPRVSIAMFGGSTLWGASARDDFTIPSLVSKRLAAAGVNAQVANYAVDADVSSQSLIRLVLALRGAKAPDIVVFYGGLMDCYSTYAQGSVGLPYGAARYQQLVLDDTGVPRPPAPGDALRNMALLRFAGDTAAYLQNAAHGGYWIARSQWPELAGGAANLYLQNARFARALGRAYGFKTLFYWEPQLSEKPHRTDYENRKFAEQEHKAPGTYAFCFGMGGAVQEQQRELLGEAAVRDLRAIFAEVRAPLFVDGAHYGEAANAIVARRIAADILQMRGSNPAPEQ